MSLLELDKVCFRYRCDEALILQEVSFLVNRGECHCISGPTGSGKSTLIKLIMGVLPRPYEGEFYVADNLTLGLVMQDPNVQFIRQSVGAEIAFALENLCVPTELMRAKVRSALRKVGLFVRLDMPIELLSLGQKYRVMMASQLVCEPDILLLDEPWAQLDNIGVEELLLVLSQLKQDGVAIVLVDHNPQAFSDVVDDFYYIKEGTLVAGSPTPATIDDINAGPVRLDTRVMQIEPFEFRFSNQDPLFKSVHRLNLYSGEIISLIGDNGSGKSSFLKSLAGIQSDIGELPFTVLGKQVKLGGVGAELGLLLQSPNRQLFESSVLEEVQFSLKRFDLPLIWAGQLLDELGLSHLKHHSPHTLSYGQQHMVALASLAAFKPKILLLDDPFAGLDSEYLNRVWHLLTKLSRNGCAILLSCHRQMLTLPVTRYWRIHDGVLCSDGENQALGAA
ncbi:MAG: energy-coupling factor transporter ATP-binding protein EcfA2 [Shewanella sp.]|jgi:energy-coupling factor transporter ATP-binding protein EcfA2